MPKKQDNPVELGDAAVQPEEVVATTPVSIDGPGVICDRCQPGSDADKMLQNLAGQPKVRTRIPRQGKEPADAFDTVILDGLRINILKGVTVDLPEQVADIIEDSYYRTDAAINDAKVTNPFTGKVANARIDLKDAADQNQLT